MKIDYHMHFEYGGYDLDWARGFLDSARARGIDEIGISEHSHGFREFRELYERDLILDDSPIGRYQRQWLGQNKFRYRLDEYFAFMDKLKSEGYPVKTGVEVCNFSDQAAVRRIVEPYDFDYRIGSVHFLNGWGYDFAALQFVWQEYALEDIYEWYVTAIEHLAASGNYDILGHPFNIRLFKHFPAFDVTPLLERAAKALADGGMAIDINTGTLYRYPVAEISPYPDFLRLARAYHLPIITSSDAHQPEDCGRFIDAAVAYAKAFGYDEVETYSRRRRIARKL